MAKKLYTFQVPVEIRKVINIEIVDENVYFAMSAAHERARELFSDKLSKGELAIDDFEIEALGQTMPGYVPDIPFCEYGEEAK
jgi:hypothetical protein